MSRRGREGGGGGGVKQSMREAKRHKESDNRVGLRSGDIKRRGGTESRRGGGKKGRRNLRRGEADVETSSQGQA